MMKQRSSLSSVVSLCLSIRPRLRSTLNLIFALMSTSVWTLTLADLTLMPWHRKSGSYISCVPINCALVDDQLGRMRITPSVFKSPNILELAVPSGRRPVVALRQRLGVGGWQRPEPGVYHEACNRGLGLGLGWHASDFAPPTRCKHDCQKRVRTLWPALLRGWPPLSLTRAQTSQSQVVASPHVHCDSCPAAPLARASG